MATEHHDSFCVFCLDDASKWNHCAFCGTTFESSDILLKHLDSCEMVPEQIKALWSE